MRRILLTGATGYVGLHLARRLSESGFETNVVVRPSSDLSRLRALSVPVAVHVHDGSAQSLRDIVEAVRPDTVFHLAAAYHRDHDTGVLDRMIVSNLQFGCQLIDAVGRVRPCMFVNTGSHFQNYHEAAYRPLNLYAAMKQAFAVISDYYRDASDMPVMHLKLFDVYGPGDWRPRLFHALRDAQISERPLKLIPDTVDMNLVYIDDVIDAFMAAGKLLHERPELSGRDYAVRADRTYRLGEVVALYERLSGKPVPVEWNARPLPERHILRPWEGEKVPGWTALTDLETGLERVLQSF